MHKEINKIKDLESSPKVIKNLFSKDEINKFLELYNKLPTTAKCNKKKMVKKL